MERRLFLTGEYGCKAIYATLIGLGTSSAYAPDEATRYLVVAGWHDSLNLGMTSRDSALPGLTRKAWLDRRYALLSVERYAPYRAALMGLSRHAGRVRVAEIAGNRVVTVTGTAPEAWQPPDRTSVVVAYAAPTKPGRVRVLLAMDARDLLTVLSGMETEGAFRVDHIYDY